MGELRSCGCSRRMQSQNSVTDPGADSGLQENWRNTEFEWRGCKKNLKYGSDVSAEFMDVAKSRRDPRARIIRHNNKAGVLVRNSFAFSLNYKACVLALPQASTMSHVHKICD